VRVRGEVVDDAVGGGLRGAEQGRDLAHGQVGAPVGRDQQDPVGEAEAPGAAFERRVGALTLELADQLRELSRRQTAEQPDHRLIRCIDHAHH
jgi:hypothetical protein